MKELLMMRKYLLAIVLTITSFLAHAQEKIEITSDDYANNQIEMADAFRADGKIYVVIAVILILLVGFFIYLILIDRKVTRLENQLDKG